MKHLACLLPLLLFVSCHNGRTQPRVETTAGEQAATAGENARYYAVSLTPDEVEAGARTDVAVVITPASGFKWNDEYPAKFEVVAPGDVTVGKTEFSQKKKEVEIGKTEARLVLPVTVSGAGRHELQVKANFSVCNDTSCKIMRKELFKLSISGK